MCKDCGCSIGASEHEKAHSHDHPTLNESKTVEVVTKILSENDHEAAHNRAHLDEKNILCINLMSSPGAGKTTLLEATIKSALFKIGVVEGDLETNRDADRIVAAGAPAHQITTGQTCHLDAFMVHKALHALPLDDLELVFIENVGNLVCPASYDVGAHLNVVLLSTPEGSDKISKYPVMFRTADLVVITKGAAREMFNFDSQEAINALRKLNPRSDIIELDSLSGEGLDKWLNYLKFKLELR
ncbi:MAG: hydrogenase nickel incorporation protein HypB [Campylobacter sp.]|nr:hydrogenase nickel incorporation protein HypB [Campylobacter sp.]